jgi:hypothetical protein
MSHSHAHTSARVVTAYRTQYPDPIVFSAGEEIATGREEPWQEHQDWLWIWCTDARGKSGWVPSGYIERLGGNRGRGLRDYSAVELDAEEGEQLAAEVEESGWLWCTNAAGRSGWIPLANVERTAPNA